MSGLRLSVAIATIVLLLCGGYLVVEKGMEQSAQRKNLQRKDAEWKKENERITEGSVTLGDIVAENAASSALPMLNIERQKDSILVEGIRIRVTSFQWLRDADQIENLAMRREAKEDSHFNREDVQSVLYTVVLYNETEQTVKVNLNSFYPAIIDKENHLVSWMEPMIFELSSSEQCTDQTNMQVTLHAKETYTGDIIALEFFTNQEFDELMHGEDYEWFVWVSPLSHVFDMEDSSQYFLKLQKDIIY